jgi:DNA-damage-inducible protein J
MAKTSMIHIRIDDELKSTAVEKLSEFGLTLSDAVRILLTRITKEGAMPAELLLNSDQYNDWFHQKVMEAMQNPSPFTEHRSAMDKAQDIIDKHRDAS